MEKTKNKKSKAVNPPIIRNWKDWINYQYPALLKLGARLIDSENALKKYTEIPNTGFALDILKTKVIMLNERTSKTLLNQNKKSLEDLLVNINLKQYGIDRNDFENQLDKARNCDITDTGSLNKLGTWCFFLAELCHEFRMEYRIGNDINKECYEAITRLFLICGDITGRAYEAIGYWTAKLPEKKINKVKRGKRQTWNGRTKEQIEKRNQIIIDKFNNSTLTQNHFANKYQKEFQLKPSQIRTVIRNAKNK